MNIKMRAKGLSEVRTELRHTAERVADSARGAMRRAAIRIRDEARINAPRDKWNLEEAIQIVRTVGNRGRLQLDIDVVPMINGVDVSQYAIIMHENYDSIINPDDPLARQGTKEKQAQYPNNVIGEKFLARAAEDEQGKLTKHLISVVTQAIKR